MVDVVRAPAEPRLVRLIRLFEGAMEQLAGPAVYPPAALEARVLLVHDVMTSRSRGFHQLEHIFIVARGLGPAQSLAAVYHDSVYVQIDHGIRPSVMERIGDLLSVDGPRVAIAKVVTDTMALMTMEIFNLSPGETLATADGANEFLSALLAVRELAGALDEQTLAEIVASIEQTIPFRGLDDQGRTPGQVLYDRLTKLAVARGWHSPAGALDDVVRRAVGLGNADVGDFAADDPATFLDGTWKLLAESNPELHSIGVYTIHEYRKALERMEGFLSRLTPSVVFHDYKGSPAPKVRALADEKTAECLGVAVLYLRTKLVAVAVVEALAMLTGGDAPLAFFLGSSREVEPDTAQLHELLTPLPPAPPPLDQVTLTLLRLFEDGRGGTTRFDTRSSPLSAYLYKTIGRSGVEALSAQAHRCFEGQSTWEALLLSLPPGLVAELARNAARFAVTRRDPLLSIAEAAELRAMGT